MSRLANHLSLVFKKIFFFPMKVKQSLFYKIIDDLVLSIVYNLKIKDILTVEDFESKCLIQK